MTGKNIEGYELKVFEKESVSDEIVTKYYNLINSIWKEIHPLEPLPPIEGLKQHFFEPIPNKQTFSWLIFKNDSIIGSCDLVIEDSNSPFFEERKNISQFWMNVHKKHRRKGLGTEMLRTIVKKN
jgi:RimJ/RimL family protein N-acetyltransferase